MGLGRIILVGAAALACAGPALAHHSAAMFDGEKSVTLVGVVREFQWTNPHSWVQLTVANAQGAPEEWSIEAAGLSGLVRRGWTHNSLKPGDKVSVMIHPLRNGNPGGNLVTVTLPDGSKLGQAPQGPGGGG